MGTTLGQYQVCAVFPPILITQSSSFRKIILTALRHQIEYDFAFGRRLEKFCE
jgi:hypothetical protein